MIAAFIGVTTLTWGGMVALGEYGAVWLKWWLGDMMGVLVIAPPLLVWLNHPRPVLSTLKVVEAVGLLTILLIASQMIFSIPEFAGHGYFTALALFPFVIWGALRFGHWGATLVTLLVSTIAIWGTALGTGPFAVNSIVGSLIGWCIFANVVAMTGLLLAASSEEQRRAELALKGANEELARQKEVAERANHAKSQFLAAASHDLRQPLHAIALYAASMKPRMAGRDAAITLGKIEAAVASMESLFCSILDISKLEAGVLVPKVSNIPAKLLLENLFEKFSLEAEVKGLQLRLRYRDVSVASDPVLLERILLNLIANALRYSDRGGVLIAARRRGGLIRFQVWDTGRGIPPEQMGRIFQEFYQVTSPQTDDSHGLGLGLAIVDGLSRLLGHPLEARSVLGKGTVFSLDVPISHDEPARDVGARETLESITRIHGLVAVVDDDVVVLDSLTGLLEEWGLQVIGAVSGEELLGKLARAPDLLITDFRLGGPDGLDVAHAVRECFPDRECQVVVITADTSEAGVSRLSDSGYHVMYKPIRPGRLRTLIANLLRSATLANRAAEA